MNREKLNPIYPNLGVTNNNNQTANDHMENVIKAMTGLLGHWYAADNIEDKALCADYPFEKSFDDILAEFVHWKVTYQKASLSTEKQDGND